MRAELTEHGVMRIMPETPTEAYALRKWSEQACVQRRDVKLIEDCFWRGSMLVTDMTVTGVERG